MSVTAAPLMAVAAGWRTARRLYPIYAGMLKQFSLPLEPCRELLSPIDRSEPEILERVQKWFDRADQEIEVCHLRQFLQMSTLASDEALRALLERHLKGSRKSASDRDKVDFLLAQYFARFAPESCDHGEVSYKQVAEVLKPVVGESPAATPSWLKPLDDTLAALKKCASLKDLLASTVVQQGRKLKSDAGEKYFSPEGAVAFTRYNFLLRLAFFHLLQAEISALRDLLGKMEGRGQTILDCSRAGLSTDETVANLRRVCAEWKKPFRAEYSGGQAFRQLLVIRELLEQALAKPLPPKPAERKPPAAEAKTQAAVIPPLQKEIISGKKEAAAEKAAPPEDEIGALAKRLAALMPEIKPKHAADSAALVLDGLRLVFSSWEIGAFLKPDDETARVMQRAVCARVMLMQAIDAKKRGKSDGPRLSHVLAITQEEAAHTQEGVARAKEARNIDAAVTLSATAKRLLKLMEEAEQA